MHLATLYGKSDFYTKGQIETALDEHRYDKKHRGYAYVLFMAQEDAAEVLGSAEVTEMMSEELSIWFFRGSRDFRPRWVASTNTTEASHLAEGD